MQTKGAGRTKPPLPHPNPEEEVEAAIDEMVEESFPASDPPSYAGGIKAGRPKRKATARATPGKTEN